MGISHNNLTATPDPISRYPNGSSKTVTGQVIISIFIVTLSLVATIGNGSFLAIFARFKNLRTFPNILFANLALVDLLNALINVSLYAINFYPVADSMKVTWAIMCSSLHLEFTLLNIVSMSTLMLDRFLALYLDLEYFTWKTTKKAHVAVSLIWLVSTVVVGLSSMALFEMDLEDAPFAESRRKIFEHRKKFIISTMATFTAAATVLGVLTNYVIFQNKNRVR